MKGTTSLLLLLLFSPATLADTVVYVALAAEKKIVLHRMNAEDGKLTRIDETTTAGEPGALTTDPKNRFLFASLRAEGKLAAFRIDARTGKLTHVNTVPAGPDPAHLSTDKDGRYLFCAYYVAAKVTVHRIGEDGSLGARPHQSIDTAEKAHAILLDPSNHYAFVPHTGPNAIFQFAFDARRGELKPATVAKLMTQENTGPRHIVFHPSKNIAYVDNEQGGSVTAYQFDRKRGTLEPMQTISTLPLEFKGTNACAEIKIHPTGKFLYVSNRGHDSIACFKVDSQDGKLTSIGQASTEKTPRSFDLDAEGRFLYAAGESSGKLAAYRIDNKTGELKRSATYDLGRQPWWVLAVRLPTGVIKVESPTDYQVFQRQSWDSGTIRLRGSLMAESGQLRWRLVSAAGDGKPETVLQDWQVVDVTKRHFDAGITAPAGGWYRLELRLEQDGQVVAESAVEHVGVGEVFVVAGQSNASNHGSKKQKTETGMVASFDGARWVPANDPQPGVQDGSKQGSFLPAFGDALYEKYRVPIGVASTGYGATSVRQWLPKGERMKNLPTINAQVRPFGPGEWECTGELFDGLMKRIEALGPRGCRAVLWHQGESDAGQARAGYPVDRQITGKQYAAFMEKLIRASRQRASWDLPWFVAQATYHSEKDPADDEFRAAQKSLWGNGLALEGPDTDALRKEFRAGVHFNPKGLQAHGKLWADKVGVFLDKVKAPEKPRGEESKSNVQLRGSFTNARLQFEKKKTGHVAFIGGSITEMNGYRPLVCDFLTKRFPETKFTFTDAGISSTCSTTGEFRLKTDVLAKGPVDLFFIEFAVNDDQDAGHARRECIRGMEGILRQALAHNPNMDIVITYFANPSMLKTIQDGKTPLTIDSHEEVARHYQVSSVHLAREVADRIRGGTLTWNQYGGVHPGRPGNELCASMIAQLLNTAWKEPLPKDASAVLHRLPDQPLDADNYGNGRFIEPKKALLGKGWTLETPDWKKLPGACRDRFRAIPLLCATEPGADLTLEFEGKAVGA